MRKAFWLVLVIMLASSALASAPRAYSAGDQIAPQVIDTDPLRGQELAVEGVVTLYFDQPMDRASVEAAFETQPLVPGTFEWIDARTVSFKPSQPLQRATEYAFILGDAARSSEGVALKDTFTLRLRTVGFLEVTQVLPADGSTGIEATATLTVIFNRPVVPLLPVEEMRTLPSPLEISPPAEGTGEWLSTSIYTFKPVGLKGGATYTVTVKQGLIDVTGSVLAEDFVFNFSTVAPRVIEVLPREGDDQQLRDRKIFVTFSQPMDTAAAESAFTLRRGAQQVNGTFEWNDRQTRLIFTPDTLLDYAAMYTVRIDRNRALSANGSPLSEDVVSVFRTIDEPAIAWTWPDHNKQEARDSGFSFRFSAPMNLKDFEKRLTIVPEPGLKYEDYSDEQGFFYNVAFSHEPSTEYTLTLDVEGFTDVYGTPLRLDPRSNLYSVVDGKAVFTWSTAAYPPEASLRTGNRLGLYSAYAPETRVFSTHRNIERINLALYALSREEFLRLVWRPYDQIDYSKTELLRRWTVGVENPLNILRYDLLRITDEGPSTPPAVVKCEGAPRTRLALRDEIIVLPDDPSPLNIRNRAGLDGNIIARAPVNSRFSIIGGPSCVDGFVWWQLRSADGRTTGWAAEGSRSQYFIGLPGMSGRVPVEATEPTPIPVDKVVAPQPLKPGAYLLTFNSPEIPRYGELSHIMLVATANVTLKAAERTVMAWVTDLQTGEPVSGASVQFYRTRTVGTGSARRTDSLDLGTAITDQNGIATLALAERVESLFQPIYAMIDDGKTLGVGYLGWDEGISPWDFNQPSNFYPENLTVYLYSDRSLYRPGQPVYFRGVLRDRSDMTYTISDIGTVPVEVVDNRNQTIYQKELEVSPFGTFSDSFTIDEAAPLGYYRIIVRPGFTGGDPKDYRGPTFVRGINVAQYRVPEFEVKVTAEQEQVVQGDTIKVEVESTFFFGGAVSNARVEWSAFSEDYYFNYKGTGRYSFFDFNDDEGYREFARPFGNQVADGQGRTDDQGRFTIELPADLGKSKQSQVFTIEARVIDESDQLIAGRASVTVHQGEFYIGAGPEQYIGTATKPQKVNLITVDWDSAPMPGTDLSIRVVERIWSSVQTVEPETGRTVWNYDVKENPVTDGEIRTDAEGKAVYEFTPPRGGIYKLYATSRDSLGNQITTSTFLWVAGPNYIPWRQQNSNRIDLKINKDSFRIGETASILVASPFQGETRALITVERGGILKTELVTMTTNSYVYELPITADMAPNAFVSVTIVKGVDETNPVAAFRAGLIQMDVETERLKLNIEITPDREQAGPRETVSYTIRVTDYQGEPVQAEVGVGLTDLAVLSLLPDTSSPILQHFYSQQGLGVRTSSSLVVSVDQQTQEILNTVKGGGGGGPEGGIFQVRQRFIDTPLWEPFVTTDVNGEATVTVTLPDQLTRWRLDARAVTLPIGETQTTLVGQATHDLLSTKPLLIRPVTPRFYVVNDKSVLVAIVNNNTGQDQEVNVKVEVSGVTLQGSPEQSATIRSLGRQRFEWPIEVQDVAEVGVTFFASTADGRYTDAAKSAVGQGEEKTLPVLRYEAPETVGTAGVIGAEGGALTEGIVLPRRFNVTQGKLDVRLDRSLAASTVDALEVLKYFPYHCTEQTISRFLPNLATYGAFSKLGIEDVALRREVTEVLMAALQRLYADQKVDGGWGWFSRDRSDPIVTAYALIGLAEAQGQGFPVDDGVIDRAVRYLQERLVRLSPGSRAPTWELNRAAFLLYALTRADAGNFSRAVRLFEIREAMSTYARAYLAMTFHLIDPTNTRYTSVLISDLNSRAIASATGIHWEETYNDYFNWNTNTRTTAIVLKALVQIQPENALIPNAVRWLMIARQADAWETTQETAWAVMALVDWMQHTGELRPAYTFGATLNGAVLAAGEQAAPENVRDSVRLRVDVQDLLRDELNRLTIERSSGEGILYYTAHLTAYLPVEQVEALDRGLSITRTYSLVGDPEAKPITEARVGDAILVTLTIVAPRDLHYVIITDPIPAGAEAVNPELATSGSVGEPPSLRLDDPLWRGWGWWWFSETELRDEKTVLYATYLPRGTYRYTYTLQAGLPGEYRVIPPTGQEFYFPEVYGRGEGMLFTLKPAAPGAEDPTDTE